MTIDTLTLTDGSRSIFDTTKNVAGGFAWTAGGCAAIAGTFFTSVKVANCFAALLRDSSGLPWLSIAKNTAVLGAGAASVLFTATAGLAAADACFGKAGESLSGTFPARIFRDMGTVLSEVFNRTFFIYAF